MSPTTHALPDNGHCHTTFAGILKHPFRRLTTTFATGILAFPELNEYCRTSQDCRQHAYVCDTRQQVCSCAEGYRADDTGRICLGAVGRRCMYDSHCVTNAYCKGQMICTCKREYGFLADDNWSCQGAFFPESKELFNKQEHAKVPDRKF
uniref:EB domain-containing protein n=1 Tax=Anopheles albimanus TaxID=7167 RepID=A0A182FQC6_ANOAL